MHTSDREKMFFYEKNFAKEFDEKMNMYDLKKRLQVVFGELLTEDIQHKELLDAGCGTGWFSKAACERGAKVTSIDLGKNLLNEVAKKCDSKRVEGSILELPFKNDFFDVIVCSEVIEHVPNPKKAIQELQRVLKPNGILVLTTPNKFWHFSLCIANLFNLRPYQGLENWLGYFELKKIIQQMNFKIEKMHGIHLFPFVIPFLNPILDLFHPFRKFLGPIMVNTAIKCKKEKCDENDGM